MKQTAKSDVQRKLKSRFWAFFIFKMYFPNSTITGFNRSRLYEYPLNCDAVTDVVEYENGTKDFNEIGNPQRAFDYVFDGLTPQQAAVLEAFYNSVRKTTPFYFTNDGNNTFSSGQTFNNFFIESYNRSHDAHKSWVMRVEFKLVGNGSQAVTLIVPSVSLASVTVVGSDLEIAGTVTDGTGNPVELRLFVNDSYLTLITDSGSFTFTIPLSDLIAGTSQRR